MVMLYVPTYPIFNAIEGGRIRDLFLLEEIMINVTLKDVLNVTGGKLLGTYDRLDTRIYAMCTDTREINGNEMFVPYKGLNVDANTLITEALTKGCSGCLTETEHDEYLDGKYYVHVSSTLEAVWKLVEFIIEQSKADIICVTGSVGKTTTTGMIANVLRQRYIVLETEDNKNDEFLCPEIVFKLTNAHDYVVLELGMGRNSSVRKMAEFLRPDMLVLTKIGYAHIVRTGSLAETRNEKCGAEQWLKRRGTVFVNADDPLQMDYTFTHMKQFYGSGMNDEFIDGMPKHLEYAIRASVAVGKHCGLTDEEISNGIRSYVPQNGRMDVYENPDKHYTLIDSSYNASIESIRMAVDTLAGYGGRHIAVIGEILEVGDYADFLHREAGKYMTADKVQILISVGRYAHAMTEAAKMNGVETYTADSIDEAYDRLLEFISSSDNENTVLIKGSHGSGVWKIAEKMKS